MSDVVKNVGVSSPTDGERADLEDKGMDVVRKVDPVNDIVVEAVQREIHDVSELSSRPSVEELYRDYDKLLDLGWSKKVMGTVDGVELCGYYKGNEGEKALWIVSGTHGNEPSGPVAIAKSIETLDELNKKGIPVVLLPLCNPWGYSKNTQFPTSGDEARCVSVIPQAGEEPVSVYAGVLGKGVQELMKDHPVGLMIDHHEDGQLKRDFPWRYYLCSIGQNWKDDEGVKLFRDELNESLSVEEPLNIPTAHGEPIVDNIEPLDDMSPLQSLLMSQASTGMIIETQSDVISLDDRVEIHCTALKKLDKIWNKMVQKN